MASTTFGMRLGSRCPVCLGGMSHGQAIFTAECSHTFHLRCAPGSALCPVCGAQWRDTPTASATAYDDDEPVEPPAPAPHSPLPHAGSGSLLVLKTHCEYPALSKSAARDGFAVLVHAKAPSSAATASSQRAPVDLVTVLDVSTSMSGEKLSLVKRAMGFVIDNLGGGDRLSVVTFDTDARRVIRLTRMTDDGKAAARRAVGSLFASGCTNIRGGLDEAAMVLDGRRHQNAVASVILLSDGQDNQSMGFSNHRDFFPGHRTFRTPNFGVLVPLSFTRSAAGHRCPPVHAFGFGTDHDAAALHGISEVTGGTFSFVEDHAAIQDAFARCVGGLLSMAAQEARVAVECLHPGVRLRAVKSGRFESRVDADGRAAAVDVGELYADEERRFLLFLDVPRAAAAAGDCDDATRLVSVRCTYRDTATGQAVEVAGSDAVVQRPVVAAAEDVAPSMEVERERVRVEAAEDIALARAAAERGDYGEAARILDARRESLGRSAPAIAGDVMCKALVAELHELSMRVADKREYEETGRACFLAGMSSHAQQRGSSTWLSRSFTGAGFGFRGCPSSSAVFATPAMRKMEALSAEKTREQQQDQQPTPPSPENGSTVVPRLEERLASAVPRLSMVRRYRRLLPPLRR